MKEINIQIPEGYEIDEDSSTFEKIIFKKKKIRKFPKTWKELIKVDGWYISTYSKINRTYGNLTQGVTDGCNKNIFPTKEEAEASLALAQLCQLRDKYNDGWKANWDSIGFKYVIIFYQENIEIDQNVHIQQVLNFKTKEIRDLFLENFRDLIEQAKPLL